jgi:hypothetical protein
MNILSMGNIALPYFPNRIQSILISPANTLSTPAQSDSSIPRQLFHSLKLWKPMGLVERLSLMWSVGLVRCLDFEQLYLMVVFVRVYLDVGVLAEEKH